MRHASLSKRHARFCLSAGAYWACRCSLHLASISFHWLSFDIGACDCDIGRRRYADFLMRLRFLTVTLFAFNSCRFDLFRFRRANMLKICIFELLARRWLRRHLFWVRLGLKITFLANIFLLSNFRLTLPDVISLLIHHLRNITG